MLLSILIPTYNRAEYLSLNLKHLSLQLLPEHKNLIEVIISNNASIDKTKDILDSYKNNPFFTILEQKQNIGAERNFLSLIESSHGQFLWIFGDDEAPLDGAINKVITLLRKNSDVGLIHIKSPKGHESLGKFDFHLKHSSPQLSDFNDPNQFLASVNYFISFITSHIFNRSYISSAINPNDFVGTNLVQETFYLQAALNSPHNIIVSDYLFSPMTNHTGGYKLFETFASHQQKIFSFFSKLGLKYSTVKQINKKMLRTAFPYWLIFLQRRPDQFQTEFIFKELFKNFKFYINFWIFCVPILVFPHRWRPGLAKFVTTVRRLISAAKQKTMQ
jgi:glycosyltransferase involved in cell wall biosynthesis